MSGRPTMSDKQKTFREFNERTKVNAHFGAEYEKLSS